jgi:hypothetical protein
LGPRAPDGVHEVVVLEGPPGGEVHGAASSVDPGRFVHDEGDALGEDVAEAVDGVVRPADELVQPDPLDELGAGIDQRHRCVLAAGQAVGRHGAGVPSAEDDDAVAPCAGVLTHGVSFLSGPVVSGFQP